MRRLRPGNTLKWTAVFGLLMLGAMPWSEKVHNDRLGIAVILFTTVGVCCVIHESKP